MLMRPDAAPTVRSALILVASMLFLSGCAGQPSGTPTGDPQRLIAQLAERVEAVDTNFPERHLEELLPNRLVSVDGGPAEPLVDGGVFIGTVAEAVPGSAFVADAESGTDLETDWRNPDADIRVFNVALAIEEGWGAAAEIDQIRFAIVVNGSADPDSSAKDISALGRIIVILEHQGSLKFDPSLYRIRGADSLLGRIDETGAVSFPLVENEADFIGTLKTGDSIEKSAGEPPTTITATDRGGYIELMR
jgi:hypothetical protein